MINILRVILRHTGLDILNKTDIDIRSIFALKRRYNRIIVVISINTHN